MLSNRFLFAIAVAVFAVILIGPANAQNRSYFKSAQSGKSQWIDAYFGWNNDCSFRTIDVDVIDKPENGRVTPKIETHRISAAQVGSTGKCKGKPTRAVAVYYQSKSGYRGTDRFRVRMKVGGQAPVTFTYSVRVR